jgi:hypothetical protein
MPLFAMLVERVEGSSDLIEEGTNVLAFTGIIVRLVKPIHQLFEIGAKLLHQIVGLLAQALERLSIRPFVGLRYLLIQLGQIAIRLHLCFVATYRLDDLLNIPLGWLRGRTVRCSLPKRWHRSENGDGDRGQQQGDDQVAAKEHSGARAHHHLPYLVGDLG